jgi:hypothetical protein
MSGIGGFSQHFLIPKELAIMFFLILDDSIVLGFSGFSPSKQVE